ncbi:hypothetical protein L1987_60739 [Smallanthus sonchifolius]|uniref:Uncharacterized protein n=1 Tax=Smallanthus sonchifolius TaxID=185202 RepID=A0ACB9D9P0_9ASTR|nr:hypothetical protein L1987_60739 [Smallanthus sonchifolius]
MAALSIIKERCTKFLLLTWKPLSLLSWAFLRNVVLASSSFIGGQSNLHYEEGKVCGVTSEGETAKCKKVVCDPSYLPNKVRKVGRAICIMSHPIPNTNDSHSVQVILPQKQLGRKSDMYLFCCSYSHNVAPKGKFISFVSTEAESDQPEVELKPGLDLLGPVDEIFYDVFD